MRAECPLKIFILFSSPDHMPLPNKAAIAISSLLSIAALFTSAPRRVSSEPAPPQYDLIIKNGLVVDGTGRRPYAADVAVKGDRIARIGRLKNSRAARVIDARGLVVAPGFIDLLGQSEMNLLIDPRAMSKVMQGVTTEITGEGDSPAPINERLISEQADYYRRYNLTVDWRTLREYFARLERQGIGVNLGTFVGATQVRAYVVGFDNRPPTADELIRMRRLVADAMEDGALGLSTSLQYVPARFARTNEIVELAMAAGRYGGIYATHQRSEANALDTSLEEVFEIARRARIPVEIWHLKTAYKKNWGRMPEVLKRIETARARGLKINADVYPYTAASTSLTACLPPWALEGGTEKMLARLRDDATRKRLKREILAETNEWENIYLGSGGAQGVLISSVVNRDLESLQGKRVSDIAAAQNKEELDALFDLIIADHGATGAIYFMMAEDDLRAALRSPFVAICTDSGARGVDGPLSSAKGHPRGWGSYPRILSRYVRDERLLSLEEAVHKMTGMPAARVRLKDRGVLREGAYADITVFDQQRVRDRSTFEEPNPYPEGIPYVIINGQVSVDQGERTKALAGRVLRGPGYRAVSNQRPTP
jgi:dihydroorotase/N-acyl-D-amino-acid deacylase